LATLPQNLEPIREAFTAKAAPVFSDFDDSIAFHMRDDGGNTGRAVSRILESLGLPVPQTAAEFIDGTDGALIFSARRGIVIRIEPASFTRINDNPWILQPLTSFTAGKAIVEICPAIGTTGDDNDMLAVAYALPASGYELNDPHVGNIGLLPVKTPGFPQGIPVLIDRPSANALSHATKNIRAALQRMGVDADPQQKLYAPLRHALKEAWPETAAAPNAGKMQNFWQLCEAYVEKGLLTAGWNTPQSAAECWKQTEAASVARRYDAKLKF